MTVLGASTSNPKPDLTTASRADSSWMVGKPYLGITSGFPVTRPQLAASAWNLEFPRADLRRDFNLRSGYGVQL